ncbi:helix-turn-helix domain-containing protein [Sphingomonas faeni]|uniref:helix-turn-helix domain-containing protein n=1 Tax=Sphingomonas faeni TaxID=185950 RepID=UPI0033450B89
MRAIRKHRRMRVSEVARAMDMPTRSYEHLEAGSGRLTYDRIVDFAEITDSDPIAILATLSFGTPDFAIRCADNKLMTIMMIAMMELDQDLGPDISYLDAQTLVGGFTKLTRELAQHVRKRETFAEEWLKQGVDRLSPVRSSPVRKLRPKTV